MELENLPGWAAAVVAVAGAVVAWLQYRQKNAPPRDRLPVVPACSDTVASELAANRERLVRLEGALEDVAKDSRAALEVLSRLERGLLTGREAILWAEHRDKLIEDVGRLVSYLRPTGFGLRGGGRPTDSL